MRTFLLTLLLIFTLPTFGEELTEEQRVNYTAAYETGVFCSAMYAIIAGSNRDDPEIFVNARTSGLLSFSSAVMFAQSLGKPLEEVEIDWMFEKENILAAAEDPEQATKLMELNSPMCITYVESYLAAIDMLPQEEPELCPTLPKKNETN